MGVAEEGQEQGASVRLVAHSHGVDPNQISAWSQPAAHDALTAAATGRRRQVRSARADDPDQRASPTLE